MRLPKQFKRAVVALLAVATLLRQPGMTVLADEEYYRTEVVNNVSIGDINIILEEWDKDAYGNLIPYRNKKLVQPGQTVTKIVDVRNVANDCWIRIKVDFESDEGMTGVDDSMLHLADEHWIYRGGYYYYTLPVYHGDTVQFIDTVHVPEDWDSSYSGKEFRIIVTSDAVQIRNFTPQFDTEDPWFGTVIEQCVHDEYEDTSYQTSDAFSVSFEGGAEGLVRVGDDFFSNWAEMMPGDTWEDKCEVRNNYNQNVKIYFYTETIAEDILIDNLILTIKNGDKVIYQGPLSGTVRPIELGNFAPGTGTTMTYSLYVPWQLNNAYALTDTKTKWIWYCKLTGSPTPVNPTPGDNPSGPTPVTPTPGGSTPTPVVPNPVKEVIDAINTGDSAPVEILTITAVAALAILVLLMVKVKRRAGNET